MKKQQNNYAFIDAQSLHKSIQKQGWILDWKKFYIYLKEKCSIKKAYVFIGFISDNKNLYRKIKNCGFKLIFKNTIIQNGRVKGNVDAELVLESLIQIDKYDKAILVTGDGDFSCLIRHLNNKSKFKILLVPNEFEYSNFLKKAAGNKISFINRHKHLLLK